MVPRSIITLALLHKFDCEFRGNNTYVSLDRTALDLVCAWRNFKNIFPRPLFTIIFRPKILSFVTSSILTGQTKVEFVIYWVLWKNKLPIWSKKTFDIFRWWFPILFVIFFHFFITCKGLDTVVSLSAGDDTRPVKA